MTQGGRLGLVIPAEAESSGAIGGRELLIPARGNDAMVGGYVFVFRGSGMTATLGSRRRGPADASPDRAHCKMWAVGVSTWISAPTDSWWAAGESARPPAAGRTSAGIIDADQTQVPACWPPW